MASARDPRQVLKEAKQIAQDHSMFVAECKDGKGETEYVLYRKCPHGNERIGKRSSVDGIRHFVCKCANFR